MTTEESIEGALGLIKRGNLAGAEAVVTTLGPSLPAFLPRSAIRAAAGAFLRAARELREGVQPATFDGQKATAVWTLTQPSEKKQRAIVDKETRVASVTMVPENSGLHVTVQNTYSSQKPTQREFDFVKAQ